MKTIEYPVLRQIAVEEIDIPNTIRHLEQKSALVSLCKSIRAVGVLEPIGVRRSESRYVLLYGSRRLIAARLAGLRTIPCLVSDADGFSADILSLHENIHRKPLHYFELSDGCIGLLKNKSHTVRQTAEVLCIAEKTVRDKCVLSVLPKDTQADILRRHLPERRAYKLCTLSDEGEPTFIERNGEKDKGYCRDLRLYLNSIRHTVDRMEQAGLEATYENEEDGDTVVWRILIKKS